MNTDEDELKIIALIKAWQKPSDKLVHVNDFTLAPQAEGFRLNIEAYVADKYDPEMGYEDKNFYGTLEQCFAGAVEYLEEEKMRLAALL